MKKYLVEIEYEVDGNSQTMKVMVNGKEMPLPPKLEKWIARNYIENVMYRD
jgi:hypothetical protein